MDFINLALDIECFLNNFCKKKITPLVKTQKGLGQQSAVAFK